ncbi:pilus assembly FimT family protein [Peptoniphilus catoniae]|uniref:pilus assembly FimT family protein n=1 Tax=Peptoniphilus catoniae TaxID=1660341 RepID=UPI0010FE71DF|nr:prepilin-type N-terminal cleavage/methylation domain-containing protein [Peptoniphilus catoniae]
MKKKGFTLIELVVSIAILASLMTIGLYNHKTSGEYRAKKDLEKIVRDIKYTRNLAMSKRKRARFFLSQDYYEISCGDYEERFDYSKDLILKSNGLINLEFTKNGISSKDTSQTIYFKISNKLYEITVEPVTGKVNLKNG